jgi:hypothetical protein
MRPLYDRLGEVAEHIDNLVQEVVGSRRGFVVIIAPHDTEHAALTVHNLKDNGEAKMVMKDFIAHAGDADE